MNWASVLGSQPTFCLKFKFATTTGSMTTLTTSTVHFALSRWKEPPPAPVGTSRHRPVVIGSVPFCAGRCRGRPKSRRDRKKHCTKKSEKVKIQRFLRSLRGTGTGRHWTAPGPSDTGTGPNLLGPAPV